MGNCGSADEPDYFEDRPWLQMTFSTPSTLQAANDSMPLQFTEELASRNPLARRRPTPVNKVVAARSPAARARRRRVLRAGVAPHHDFHFPTPIGEMGTPVTAIDFPRAPYELFPADDAPPAVAGHLQRD